MPIKMVYSKRPHITPDNHFSGTKHVPTYLTYRPGGDETLPAKFLLNSFLSKLAPPDKLHNGFGFVIQFSVGIRYVIICQGGEFDKKEFKRNLAGSVSFPPAGRWY